MNKDEVIKAGSALEKSLENKTHQVSLDILKQLQETLHATDTLLRETKIGLSVGKLRKHPDKRIADLSSEIVRKWKQDVDDAKSRGSKPAKSPIQGTKNGEKKEPRTVDSDGVSLPKLSDPVRVNCVKLAYNSLAVDADSSISPKSILGRAEAIELCTYKAHDCKPEGPYKQRIRTLCLNLKGDNVSLRREVMSGDLDVETFCKMTPAEMASDERKALNKKLQEESIFQSLAATNTKASTDAFKCGKCGKNETTYYQMQTRSADEPMTTFVTCSNCGKKWKF